jgi:hypothetical protein
MIKTASVTPMSGHIQMQGVVKLWSNGFQQIIEHHDIQTEAEVESFGRLISDIVQREAGIAELIRAALVDTRTGSLGDWSETGLGTDNSKLLNLRATLNFILDSEMDHALDIIFSNRIGSRLLQKALSFPLLLVSYIPHFFSEATFGNDGNSIRSLRGLIGSSVQPCSARQNGYFLRMKQ